MKWCEIDNSDEFREAEFEGDFDWTYSDYHLCLLLEN
jgi:hypothetical protein